MDFNLSDDIVGNDTSSFDASNLFPLTPPDSVMSATDSFYSPPVQNTKKDHFNFDIDSIATYNQGNNPTNPLLNTIMMNGTPADNMGDLTPTFMETNDINNNQNQLSIQSQPVANNYLSGSGMMTDQHSPSYNMTTPAPAANMTTLPPAYNMTTPSPAYNMTTPSPGYNMTTPSPSYSITASSPGYLNPTSLIECDNGIKSEYTKQLDCMQVMGTPEQEAKKFKSKVGRPCKLDPDEENLSPELKEKKNRRRAQNRKAAEVCRQKKKDKIRKKEEEHEFTKRENIQLRKRIEKLEAQKNWLSKKLEQHQCCLIKPKPTPLTCETGDQFKELYQYLQQ